MSKEQVIKEIIEELTDIDFTYFLNKNHKDIKDVLPSIRDNNPNLDYHNSLAREVKLENKLKDNNLLVLYGEIMCHRSFNSFWVVSLGKIDFCSDEGYQDGSETFYFLKRKDNFIISDKLDKRIKKSKGFRFNYEYSKIKLASSNISECIITKVDTYNSQKGESEYDSPFVSECILIDLDKLEV